MQTVHPLRESLHHEVHARPYERMNAPLLLSHIALVGNAGGAERDHVAKLLESRQLAVPADGASHLSADIGGLRLRWEKHGEFHTCTFWKQLAEVPEGFDQLPIGDVPLDWRHGLPGEWLVGLHVLVKPAVTPRHEVPPLVRSMLHEDSLVGARVMDGSADVYTDFRLYGDGFARWVVVAGDMTPRRLGRLVQRLQEIETYRMMALLGLPVAREVGGALVGAERDLADVAERIRTASPDDEQELLRQLTQLAARVEGLYARTHARFSASAAYFELVQRRIEELREERVHNLQTVREFMDRRLLPAMQTCAWAGRRLQALSERISRVSNLLRTRVEIEQQQSSRELLDAMNRRQKAQLLLQSAVEGFSVAAVTYYGAGLVGYAAKGAKSAGWNVSPDLAVAISIPLIALAVWFGVRRLHREAHAAAHRDSESFR
ncbi:MAG TPA: DUF3422 domain-containing protein [Piscinibacter sp.]|uniref:DUF3422 family protein n=1 Tax=Piscinibacter sp. TaxID=1903157 RepID=UPI001D3B7116|nr:DUF3422 domain-containing protein [Piscinibacter sp.]MBK7531888.1 DUF3422 domain-containing protein [Piscinibacter sp.]HPG79974.1 DUF3422 domain-containing protein [Piscinibacter sp.]HPM66959.1 DUF3422 domain-containing protein [Piscinibacter sp.]